MKNNKLYRFLHEDHKWRRFKAYIRFATWKLRCKPQFLIIGAQKSGTTSLFYYLKQYPGLVPAIYKEIHYFDGGLHPAADNFKAGEKWYRAQFPLRILHSNEIPFEASPNYIFNPNTSQRVYKYAPNMKFICLLRDPTERAISHYFHERRLGREPLSIAEAFRTEEERLNDVIKNQNYKSPSFIQYSYKSRGIYIHQIKKYLEYYNIEQFCIINSERFFKNPHDVLEEISRFIGLKRSYKISDLSPKNVGSNKEKVSPEIYQMLNEYFRPYNEALFALINKRFPWGVKK